MAYRLANEIDSGQRDGMAGFSQNKDKDNTAIGSVKSKGTGKGTDGAAGAGTSKMDEDEERDAVFYRLEMLGYRVGQGLVERYVTYLLYIL
jgi:hypothetical protein